jgi:putative tryptophan/tyrosine transport system substrate-binding protein
MTARRQALAILGSAALAPCAWAKDAVRVVGYLSNGAGADVLAKPLARFGYAEGRNIRFEVRMTSRDEAELDRSAAELVAARPEVMVSFGIRNIRALARHTSTIPIVCGETADPVGLGIARSLARPGGNITGLSAGIPEVAPILVGLMRAVRPALRRIITLVGEDTSGRAGDHWGRIIQAAIGEAKRVGLAWEIRSLATPEGLERALSGLSPDSDILYTIAPPQGVKDIQVATLTRRRRLAIVSAGTGLVRAGGLMSYSIDHADPMGRVAALVHKLLRGAKPADTPFELPDRTTFLVNRATARAIGVELPPHVLVRATEIID